MMQRRFSEALADFQNAARCGHRPENVAEWIRRAQSAVQDAAAQDQHRAVALADARRRMEQGSLAGAREVLAHLPKEDPARCDMEQALERLTADADKALRSAEAALDRDDAAAAVDSLLRAKALDPKSSEAAGMETRAVQRVTQRARTWYESGRLDRMAQELSLLRDLGLSQTERIEAEELLRLATEAARAINEGRYARADVALARLTQIGPAAAWLAAAKAQVAALEENRRAILQGPLGLLSGKDAGPLVSARAVDPAETRPAPAAVEEDPRAPRPAAVAPAIPAPAPPRAMARRKLLLRIDGVGSFLLLRGDRVSIGRAGPSATADLPLISDLSERHAEIIRVGDDYFLVSNSGVGLAGRPVDYALLQEGDRIRLGKRLKMTFRRPSLKSNTAVLDLGEGVRTTTDCRRVILWDGPVLLGGKQECHVPVAGSSVAAVLIQRNGEFVIRPVGPGSATTRLALDRTVEFAGMTMSLRSWEDASRGRVVG